MSFQDVRGAIQKLTSDALANATPSPIPFTQHCFDNVQEDAPVDPSGSYAVINVSFPNVVKETIGCEGIDAIIGSCNVLLYTPKGQGMKPAEDALLAVVKAWIAENAKRMPPKPAVGGNTVVSLRTRNINGPNAIAPDQRPHQVTQLSCAFTAIAQDPPTP